MKNFDINVKNYKRKIEFVKKKGKRTYYESFHNIWRHHPNKKKLLSKVFHTKNKIITKIFLCEKCRV